MKAILGQKIGMSQVFSSQGEVVPVTLITCIPNVVTLQRRQDRDKHDAIQVGLPNINKAEVAGKRKKLTSGKSRKQYIARREFFIGGDNGKVATLTVGQFKEGDVVQVSGISKGKGFQGVVKRHGFKGGPASHGHRHVLRRPGSIGSAFPQHVMKGKKMAGRMGGDRVTVKNLTVVRVDVEANLIAVKGAVPGRKGTVLEIKAAADSRVE